MAVFCVGALILAGAIIWAIIALMMEATSTSELLVNLYQTTQRYNQGDRHIHTRRH
jgi:hypothetical protein